MALEAIQRTFLKNSKLRKSRIGFIMKNFANELPSENFQCPVVCLEHGSQEEEFYEANALPSELAGPATCRICFMAKFSRVLEFRLEIF